MSAVLLSHQACRHEFPTVGACSNSAFVKSASSQVLQYWALSCLAFIGDADRRKQKTKKKKAERTLRCVILLLNRSSRQKRRNRWSSERSCFHWLSSEAVWLGSLRLRLHSCRTSELLMLLRLENNPLGSSSLSSSSSSAAVCGRLQCGRYILHQTCHTGMYTSSRCPLNQLCATPF